MIEKRIHEGHSPICLAQEDACDEAEIEALRSALSKAESESTRLKAEVSTFKESAAEDTRTINRLSEKVQWLEDAIEKRWKVEEREWRKEETRLKAEAKKAADSLDLAEWNRAQAVKQWQEADAELTRLREREKAKSEELKAKAYRAYCDYIAVSKTTECLGWEAKVKTGAFGASELAAHERAAELLGTHRGLMQAVAALSAEPEGKGKK